MTLSPRERQVLQVASRGLSNSQIDAELYITEAAVTEALRRGLLELD